MLIAEEYHYISTRYPSLYPVSDKRIMVHSSVLGFPRIGELQLFMPITRITDYAHEGSKREVKFAVESYWTNKMSAEDLQKVAVEVRKASWKSLMAHGVDQIPR